MKNKYISLYLCFSIFITISLYILSTANIDLNSHFVSLFSFSVIAITWLLMVVYYRNIFNIVSLLNIFIILFLYGKILLFLIDSSFEINRFWFLKNIYFDNKVINEVILHSTLFVLFLNLGIISVYLNKYSSITSRNLRTLRDNSIFVSSFYVIAVLFLVKNIIEFKFVIQNGYLSFYDGGFVDINYYSNIIKYSHVLFIPIFSYIISHRLERREALVILILFIILSIFDSLKGARGLFILPLLFSLWYYYQFYKINTFTLINVFNFKFISIIITVIFVSILLKNQRTEGRSSSETEILMNIPKVILTETGKTFHIMSTYYVHKNNLVYEYPYMLEPIFYPYFYFTNFEIMTGGQTRKLVKIRNSFDDRLTYYLNHNYYLSGGGLGSSFAAESLQFGFFLGGIVCLFLGFLIGTYMKNISNKWLLYLSPIIVQHIIFLSRNTTFPNLISITKHIFMYGVILLGYKLFKIIRSVYCKERSAKI